MCKILFSKIIVVGVDYVSNFKVNILRFCLDLDVLKVENSWAVSCHNGWASWGFWESDQQFSGAETGVDWQLVFQIVLQGDNKSADTL